MSHVYQSSFFRFVTAAIAVTLLFLAPAAHAAQSTVRGTVTDSLGAGVYNARVELLTLNGAQIAGFTYTDARGAYNLTTAQPGRYVVRVLAAGFNESYSHEIYISAARPAYQDMVMQLGKLMQHVTVTATGTATPQSQTGASVTVLDQTLYPHLPDIQDTLRLDCNWSRPASVARRRPYLRWAATPMPRT